MRVAERRCSLVRIDQRLVCRGTDAFKADKSARVASGSTSEIFRNAAACIVGAYTPFAPDSSVVLDSAEPRHHEFAVTNEKRHRR